MPRPKKVQTAVQKLPRISVLQKRLAQPFGEGSPAIQLKEPGWTVHVINTRIRPGRYHDVIRNKGWVPVAPEDIDGSVEDFGFDVRDGRVVRGDRGEEVVVKMPAEDYLEIQMAKDAANKRRTTPTNLKADVANATAKAHGDQAGDYVHQHTEITTSRSPVPLEGDEPA